MSLPFFQLKQPSYISPKKIPFKYPNITSPKLKPNKFLFKSRNIHNIKAFSQSPTNQIKTHSLILNYIKQPIKDERLCKEFIQQSNIDKVILLYKQRKLLSRQQKRLNESSKNMTRYYSNTLNNNENNNYINSYRDKQTINKDSCTINSKYTNASTQTVDTTSFALRKVDVFQNDFIKYRIKNDVKNKKMNTYYKQMKFVNASSSSRTISDKHQNNNNNTMNSGLNNSRSTMYKTHHIFVNGKYL
jgi:hypothetical protein